MNPRDLPSIWLWNFGLRNRGVRLLAPLSRLRAIIGVQESPRERHVGSPLDGAPPVWLRAIRAREGIPEDQRRMLAEVRERYVHEVTWDDMTISEELAVFLWGLCLAVVPRVIVDLGSGMSSYVFRRYAESREDVRVWSVDDDPAWLAQTRVLLRAHNLPEGGLVEWERFRASPPDAIDLVFYDLGTFETRIKTLPEVLSLLPVKVPCVLDDTHRLSYWREVQRLAESVARCAAPAAA